MVIHTVSDYILREFTLISEHRWRVSNV